jgi:hypothetical protein
MMEILKSPMMALLQNVLQKIMCPNNVLNRDAYFRTFKSTLYDMAKAAALSSPSLDKTTTVAKANFQNVFVHLWFAIPLFESYTQQGVKVQLGTKRMCLKAFVRNTMSRNYNQVLDRLAKKYLTK